MSALMSHVPTVSGTSDEAHAPLTQARLRSAGLGAFFRPSQLEALGIGYDALRSLVTEGMVERVARGLYHLAGAEATEHHTLAAACARVPRAIVCLLSALQVHGIGTQLPREVWLAIPHKARPPRVPGIRIRLLRFSGAAWACGVGDIELRRGSGAHHRSRPNGCRLLPFRAPRRAGGRHGGAPRWPPSEAGDIRRALPKPRGPALTEASRRTRRDGAMSPDVAASIKARLLNRARESSDDARALPRTLRVRTVLVPARSLCATRDMRSKGAGLLALWMDDPYRSTRDIDLLAFGSNDEVAIRRLVKTICEVPCPEDGLAFDLDGLEVSPIRADEEYQGQRVVLRVHLGKARIRLQVDFGFGDAVIPGPQDAMYPTLLDGLAAPWLRTYPAVVTIAEKPRPW